MQNNDIIKCGDNIFRVLDISSKNVFVIDCRKKSSPKWICLDTLSDYEVYENTEFSLPDINDLDLLSRKIAHERFTLIAGVLPFISDKKRRCAAVSHIADSKGISLQTVNYYLWLYLSHQNISALVPKSKKQEKKLTADDKNFRWALNKYYYTSHGHTLNTTYTLLLKEKYCNTEGGLLSQYPSFYQFRYFYRKHKKMQNYYISRNGLKHYQRNNRPLLGDGIQEFAPAVGVGMLDATVCDIYLVNESGGIVGRPILTACVDAYSGMCCGYNLSWEGGVYSLRSLMLNIISDKKELCFKYGITLTDDEWNVDKLPATLVTDMGKEYISDTFSQISDLGITIVNLPPYRPELKGGIEKFFDIIQSLYRPHLKSRGIIEPDYQERGTRDYRKDACLTLNDFEKVILQCIIHYNTKRVIENFPYTEDMRKQQIKPYANCLWNYGLTQLGANLITTNYETLILTLLPRTTGKFTRKGLVVNKLRYKNDSYVEKFLSGGTAIVAYNPEDVSSVWLIDNGKYTVFHLITQRFEGISLVEVSDIRQQENALKSAEKTAVLQAKIDLANSIQAVVNSAEHVSDADIKGIRENRRREQIKTHIDFMNDGVADE